MFSRYKKDRPDTRQQARRGPPESRRDAADTAPQGAGPCASPAGDGAANPRDKERKRKERLGEIKLELHRSCSTTSI